MAISAGDQVLVTFETNVNGQVCLSTFGYVTPDANPVVGVDVAMTGIITQLKAGGGGGDVLESDFLDCMSEDAILQKITAQLVRPTRYAKVSQSIVSPGTVVAPVNFQQSCGVITRRAALAGRKYTSTLHVPGMPDTFANEGIISSAYSTALTALATALKVTLTDAGNSLTWFPSILHRSGVPQFSYLDTTEVQSTIRTMRRRVVGRGI